ncbi:hypothetical protein NC653_037586 [Populus alba x Populus x berolinensis]|uniref:Uncharacterized protein n=1 Tax=Populus alba x Populus x berolinensis TaxID=444605 RepID=A0AAD6PS90_9ROSI|nr:hypothetical protein NC653_037586 [Populus alba x Populus x berolinensis]
MFKWLKIFLQEFLKGELERGQKLTISTSSNSSNPARFLFKDEYVDAGDLKEEIV